MVSRAISPPAFSRFVVGDAIVVLRGMTDDSVDVVLTSPPFLGLRSYLPASDPNKALELGTEPAPGQYLDRLLDVVEECRRVLAPHGSLCIELGDTYAGSGGSGGDYRPGGRREGQATWMGTARSARESSAKIPWRSPEADRRKRPGAWENPQHVGGPLRDRAYDEAKGIRPTSAHWRGQRIGWPLDKSLCMVPELLRLALAYGFNPLTGRETPRWRIRNVVRWERPNPPVGDLSDKFRPDTSELLVACVGRRRYFDLDAVRSPSDYERNRPVKRRTAYSKRPNTALDTVHPAGAPPLDWWSWDPTDEEWEEWLGDQFPDQSWVVSTEAYTGAHFATWPRRLLLRPIEAMCPRRVCTFCGVPSERLVDRASTGQNSRRSRATEADRRQAGAVSPTVFPAYAERRTLGWSCCGCGPSCHPTTYEQRLVDVAAVDPLTGDAVGTKGRKRRVVADPGCCDGSHWRPGLVLDPMAGAGTTLAVASGLGRASIGIDLDARNADLALGRVGMWLEFDSRPGSVAGGVTPGWGG